MRIFLLFCFFLVSIVLRAQDNENDIYDTAKRIDPLSTSPESAYRNGNYKQPYDSTMLFLSQYDAIRKNSIGIQNLGDIGTPYIQQLFQLNTQTGFLSGLNPFGDIYYSHANAKNYLTKIPFSEFNYAQGSAGQRGLINFDGFHTQNIGKNFNFSVKYHSVSYDGFYKNQTTTNKNLHFNSYYITKNKRYQIFTYLSWNKANLTINGGIDTSRETDTSFRKYSGNSRLVDVQLNNSKFINRLSEYKFKQAYALIQGKDSTNLLSIGHDFTYSKQSNYYTNSSVDFGYFDSVYFFNANKTGDSINFHNYSNAIEIFTPLKNKGISFKGGIQYDQLNYTSYIDEGNYSKLRQHNLSLFSSFNFSFLNSFNSLASGRLFLEGFNAGDYQLEWKNNSEVSKKHRLNLNADLLVGSRQAMFIQTAMFSNHYLFNQTFSPIQYKTISLEVNRLFKHPIYKEAYTYTLPKKQYGLKLNYSLIDNYIYSNLNGISEQGAKGQNCIQTELYAHINLKKLQLHQELAYQTFSNNLESTVQLPKFISKTSVYYQTYGFKKAGFFQIGFDAYASSSYTARVFNPATLQYQLTNHQVGAYPFVDFFIHAEVKTARIFFRMEHINMDLPNDRYYKNYLFTSPYYPASPRRFRIGFNWRFYY